MLKIKNDGIWKKEDLPLCIRDILGPTQGCLVFQEQFMQIMNRIGGLTVAQTNVFRKIVSKKIERFKERRKNEKNLLLTKKSLLK